MKLIKMFIFIHTMSYVYASGLILTPQEQKIVQSHPIKSTSTGLLNKAIDTITEEEKSKIDEHWIYIGDNKISYKNLYSILFLLILFLLLMGVWLYPLHKKIKNKNKTEKELKKLVYLDFLTSIYNRNMLDISLEKEIALSNRYEKPMSMIFFDIDMFKHVNDTYGHKKGDIILEDLTKLISSNIRHSDIFGRWGGDEFLLILPNTAKKEAQKLSVKFYNLIKTHTFKVDTPITCSFGVTEYQVGDTPKEMIVRAEKLLYEHKTTGNNFNFHVQRHDP